MSSDEVHIMNDEDRREAIKNILANARYTLDEFKAIAALDGGHGDEFDDEKSRSQWSALEFLLPKEELQ